MPVLMVWEPVTYDSDATTSLRSSLVFEIDWEAFETLPVVSSICVRSRGPRNGRYLYRQPMRTDAYPASTNTRFVNVDVHFRCTRLDIGNVRLLPASPSIPRLSSTLLYSY